MHDLKISVVVAAYNVGAYLEKCLSSIVDQTYTNLEIICVDDGSPDDSGDICDAFARRDARVSVIHKANGGVSTARNAGIERVTGDFISFIDGDDWLEPDMYEKLMANITSEQVDISACGYFEDDGGACRPVENELPVPEHPMDMRDFLKYVYIRDKYRSVGIYLWCKLFRKSLIFDSGIRFDPALCVGQDQKFAAQCFMAARKIVYTHEHLYHYVQRQGSAMHDTKRKLDRLTLCEAYQAVIDLYEGHGVDAAVVDYVKRFYVYHASRLLKLAFEAGAVDKISPLKGNIRKYFDVYCRTNQEHPERMEEVRQLLGRTS